MDFSLSNQHMHRLRIYCPNSFGLILILHIKQDMLCRIGLGPHTHPESLCWEWENKRAGIQGQLGALDGGVPRENVHRLLENEIPTLFYIYKQQRYPEQSST